MDQLLNIQDFSTLPHLPVGEYKRFPDCSVVYFAFCPTEGLLYIGRAKSLKKRWRRGAHLWLRCVVKTYVAWFQVEESELEDLEKLLILHYQPIGNIQYNRGKKRN